MFSNKIVHLIGIGGISMSSIALILLNENTSVQGSDIKESELTKKLENKGIKILYGHHPEMINKADIDRYNTISDLSKNYEIESFKLGNMMTSIEGGDRVNGKCSNLMNQNSFEYRLLTYLTLFFGTILQTTSTSPIFPWVSSTTVYPG